jgi:hypothetical protein
MLMRSTGLWRLSHNPANVTPQVGHDHAAVGELRSMSLRLRTLALCVILAPWVLAIRVQAPRPDLVVVLTVDQLRPDYFARWQGQWTGGFGRVLAQSAFFPNGQQDHAATETAPGHATILSGRHPAHTGIPLNELGVADSTVTLIGVSGPGASPHRFIGTTLVDWLARSDSGLRFLSVSRKDRSAILPVGRSKGPVFWFGQGQFTTSTWYADTLPAWVREWNSRRGPDRLGGSSWTLLLPDSAYPEPDDQPWEHAGREITFPHALPADSAGVLEQLGEWPWLDSLTLDFALTGARALGLGTRGRPDLLAVGLSATDYIGHEWGPDSRELHDHLLRLDRWLGPFLDSLTALTANRRVLVVLTADHGVTSFPEYARARGRPGGRIALGRLVSEVNRTANGALWESAGLIYADTARLRAAGVSPESLATALAARVQKLPGVVDAWTPATLGAPLPSNLAAARWRRTLSRTFPWLVCAAAAPGYIWANSGGSTTHGTTNPDDAGVPIAFLGAAIPAGVFPDTVRTVDIAPTLARLLGVKPGEKLDGRVIRRVLK